MRTFRRSSGTRVVGSSKLAGGIRPADHKQHTLRSVIMDSPIPATLTIPLQQHQGSPARPIVKRGDSVLKGQLLATATNQTSLPVHAPTSGVVINIQSSPYPDEFCSAQPAIELRTDGHDQWVELEPVRNWSKLPPADIVSLLQQAGICGLGGAGFPAHRKFLAGESTELLIVNGIECEPYITADQALLREYAEQVVAGARILLHTSGAKRCVIATESDKRDAIEALDVALEKLLPESELELVKLTPRYPLGSEQQLIEAVTGKQIPSGKHAVDLGMLVFNAGTVKAVYDAIELGRPLISRVTTVCGDTLKTPKNFHVLVGTPVRFLLSLCGADSNRIDRLVVGGSLMGHALYNPDVPVIKTTNCLIAGSRLDFPPQPTARACIRCDFCSSTCPVSLMPQLLYQSLRSNRIDMAEQLGLADCIECGACAYICPSNIPLVQYYRAGKFELTLRQQQQQRSQYRKQRFESRKQRLARDAAQRRGSRRRSVARPENPEVADSGLQTFSRDQARIEIADAVARVKARKTKPDSVEQSSTPKEGQ